MATGWPRKVSRLWNSSYPINETNRYWRLYPPSTHWIMFIRSCRILLSSRAVCWIGLIRISILRLLMLRKPISISSKYAILYVGWRISKKSHCQSGYLRSGIAHNLIYTYLGLQVSRKPWFLYKFWMFYPFFYLK